jgi:hypothetical protein
MAYSIKRQESTGLWVILDDSGKVLSRAELPTDAVNLAVAKGADRAELSNIPAEAATIEQAEQAAIAARNPANNAPVEPAPQTTEQAEQSGPVTTNETNSNTIATDSAGGQEESSTNEQPAENVDNGIDESAEYTTDSLGNTFKNGTLYRAVEVDDTTGQKLNTFDSSGRLINVSKGAMPAIPPSAQAQWPEAKDLRVKLRVPNEYLTGKASGPSNILQKNGGILFPYTPQITMENSASYANQNPLHSNYPLYFYKNSSISPISVTAKFTVQNEFEGAVLLSIIHMLRALTKMKFGNDPDAGAPPPVCRFDAYGDYMMFNVPVAIASWRHELPDSVDYISVGRRGSPTTYGHSMVPTMSTISLTLNPMYSRREMLEHNTKDWLSGGLARRGYL